MAIIYYDYDVIKATNSDSIEFEPHYDSFLDEAYILAYDKKTGGILCHSDNKDKQAAEKEITDFINKHK